MGKIKPALEEYRPDSRLIDERGPTPQRARHGDWPPNVALSRKLITEQQYEAAEKFYVFWFRGACGAGCKSPELDAIFGGFGPKDGLIGHEKHAFYNQQIARAIKELDPTDHPPKSWIIVDWIINHASLESIGRRMGKNNKPQAVSAANTAVCFLLDSLCKLWGIYHRKNKW